METITAVESDQNYDKWKWRMLALQMITLALSIALTTENCLYIEHVVQSHHKYKLVYKSDHIRHVVNIS